MIEIETYKLIGAMIIVFIIGMRFQYSIINTLAEQQNIHIRAGKFYLFTGGMIETALIKKTKPEDLAQTIIRSIDSDAVAKKVAEAVVATMTSSFDDNDDKP